jgi:regulation of enolase protein 1 (concanavalin A-like superfamily)
MNTSTLNTLRRHFEQPQEGATLAKHIPTAKPQIQIFWALIPLLVLAAIPTPLWAAETETPRSIAGWGEVSDPDGDCTVSSDRGKLTIAIPGSDHALGMERGQMNAARVLREVQGDFVAQVKVSGTYPSNTTSQVRGRRAFQGAGLVLWADAHTYVRLERAQLVVAQQNMTYASFELRRNGALEISGSADQYPLQGKDTILKLERHADTLSAAVSPDGVTWTKLKPMNVELPATVHVGVVAGHNTTTPLTAVFQDFSVTPSPVGATTK